MLVLIKKYYWLILSIMWAALAVRVFLPHLWGWPLVALATVLNGSLAGLIPQFTQLRGYWLATLVMSGILSTALACSFWSVWAGIPLLMAIATTLAIAVMILVDNDIFLGAGVATVAMIVLNTIVVWSWAAGSDIKWSLTLAHAIAVFLAPIAIVIIRADVPEPTN